MNDKKFWEAAEEIVHTELQPELSDVTQQLIAQAQKINMFTRMNGFGDGRSTNITKIIKRHVCGKKEFLPFDVTLGADTNTWRVACSDVPEGSVLVTHIWGTDLLCDCIDYPYEYVCKDCKICIHMYTCSCGEVDDFPALICKHIHAVVQYGESVVQKPDINTHILTAHRSPGHKWPNPIIYKFNVKCGKQGSPKTLVPVSSERVNVVDELECGRFMLPVDWDSDERKHDIAQEQIKNDIKNTALEWVRVKQGLMDGTLFSKEKNMNI